MDFVSVRGRMLPRRKSVAHSSHSGTSHLIIGSAATEPFFFFDRVLFWWVAVCCGRWRRR